MAMRLQELHPSLVHFPIALLPVALGADALGRATGSTPLMDMGRRTMPLAAAGALLAGLSGLIAQETVKLEGHAGEMLVTHRNLNLGVIALSETLAAKRSRRKRPSLGYLAAGLAGLAAATYSAYLGGHMVYAHGVGVEKADGLDREAAPKMTPDNAGEALRLSAEHLRKGAGYTVQSLSRGEIVPWLTHPHQEEKETLSGKQA